MKVNTVIPHERFFALPNAFTDALAEDLSTGTWIQAMPFASYDHPIYGEVNITEQIVNVMADNFRNNVFGQDVPITYEHFGMDPAKGYKAAGWVQDVDVREDGFWWKVNFTEEAVDEVKQGAWRYFSPEYHDVWQDAETGTIYTYVVVGGALTNQPFLKGMVPLNFSTLLAAGTPDTIPSGSNADWEHSEPASDTPREDDEETIDGEGTRGPSPDVEPEPEDYAMSDFLTLLGSTLELPEDADEDAVAAAVANLVAEVAPLREAASAASERQAFSESFPAEFARLQALEQRDRENTAKAFADRYANLRLVKGEGDTAEATPYGFSAKTVEQVEKMHLAFSNGRMAQEHIEAVLDSLMNTGLVNYGEVGSATESETPENAPKAFAALVAQIRTDEKLDYAAAIREAATREPDLFAEYRKATSTR
jgi:hypothetical protein